MRTKRYVVGDIHGCYDEFMDLMVEICNDAGQNPIEVYLLGDLIDKGPKSVQVVTEFLGTLGVGIKLFCIMGNHEEKFVRWNSHETVRLKTGKANPTKAHYDYTGLTSFAEKLRELPLWIKIPDSDVLLVHGGIEPAMKSLPPDKLEGCRKAEKNLLRVRYVNTNGYMVPLGEESLEQGDSWWAEQYDGRFGLVIYGHQAFQEPKIDKHAIGIDTGCVHGNKLTAVCIDENLRTNPKFIQVKAAKKYASTYEEDHAAE